jgi:hypothetical protein
MRMKSGTQVPDFTITLLSLFFRNLPVAGIWSEGAEMSTWLKVFFENHVSRLRKEAVVEM